MEIAIPDNMLDW